MPTLTEHERKILDLVQSRPEIVGDKEVRKKVAAQIGISEKTLRNRIADLKRYGLVASPSGSPGGPVVPLPPSLREEPDFLTYIKFLITKRKVVFTSFLGAVLLSIGISLTMPKTFRATAIIMPPSTQPELGMLRTISNLPFPGLNLGVAETESMTFLAILNSRTVMESVIRKFGLIEFYGEKNMEEAVKALRENVETGIEEEGTITISVDVSTGWLSDAREDRASAGLSADIANHLITNLDSVNKKLKTDKARFQRQFIEKRYHENIKDLRNAEERLKAFQENNNMIALPEQTEAAIQAAASIKAEIIANHVKANVLSQVLSSDHPDVGRIQKEIAELEIQLGQMEKGAGKKDLFPAFSEVPDLGIQLVRLERDVEIQNALFTFLTQQYEEAKIKEAKDTPTVQVLDSAVRPERKHRPKRAVIVAFSGLMGILLSVFSITIRERYTPTLSK